MRKKTVDPPAVADDIWRGFLVTDVWFYDEAFNDVEFPIVDADLRLRHYQGMAAPVADGLAVRIRDAELLVIPWHRVYETRYDLSSMLPGLTAAQAVNTPSGVTYG